MTDNTPELDVQIGDACEIDPAAGPIEATDNIGESNRDVLLYVNAWCGDCRRAIRFLDEYEIPYRTIDLDDHPESAEIVEALNRGSRSVPTVVVDGIHVATEPSRAELAGIFGIEEEAPSGVLGRLRRA
ncbi:MAG: glutaredoxin family protein [Chloroflexota bacterium]|nr:glutaredoxin family protein [Chloroflexota bacterium]